MRHYIAQITTKDGETEYTQYIHLKVIPEDTFNATIHSYMLQYWGDHTKYHDGAYWSDGDMQASKLDDFKLIPENDLLTVQKYIGI